jgi:hypothetical protein
MYAYTVPADQIGDQQVDIETETLTDVDQDFAYWRKFNHLHGWMENLYRAKNGKDPHFNCVTVRLMPEDIAELERIYVRLLAGDK